MIVALSLFLILSQTGDPLLFARARGHTENGEFDRAIVLWQEMAERHPRSTEPLVYLSMAQRRGEDFEAAGESLEQALVLEPDDGRALWQLGLLRNLQQRPEEALAAFDRLAANAEILHQRQADRQASYHYQRGVALKALDREEEAAAAMQTANERDPELFAAAYSLYLSLRATDRQAADAQLERVEALRNSQPDWIRNDILRLEAGPLSRIEWPAAYGGLQPKGAGDLYTLRLDGIRTHPQGLGAKVEIWAEGKILRRSYDEASLYFRIPDGSRIDVLRIVWPHGMAQNVFDIETRELPDRTLVVREELFIKGSWGGVKIQD